MKIGAYIIYIGALGLSIAACDTNTRGSTGQSEFEIVSASDTPIVWELDSFKMKYWAAGWNENYSARRFFAKARGPGRCDTLEYGCPN